ncbi:MAG: hypothetical protein LKE54_01580 [Prevotella sp.]|jgi:predicted nucleotide-binding protein|nr:hypothetical protein [Prevotella sp.]MCH3993746.1 hypothetical protein [Prevotella sp.]
MERDKIFINCPFDEEYRPLLRAMLYVACFYKLTPLISTSRDSKKNRLEDIIKMMKKAKYSIHDLSRMEARSSGDIYRMNMPFELGLNYGLGVEDKVFLIFEGEQYKVKRALSDIDGWDIKCHKNDPEIVVREFRKWFVENNPTIDDSLKLSSAELWKKYNYFNGFYYDKKYLKPEEVSNSEYIEYINEFLSQDY